VIRKDWAQEVAERTGFNHWIYVTDCCEALARVLEDGQSGQAYNISADNPRTNLELVGELLTRLGKDESSIDYVKDRPGHDRRYAIDSTKMLKLGWKADYTRDQFERGLQETVQWYLDNPEWVEKARERMSEINQHIGR